MRIIQTIKPIGFEDTTIDGLPIRQFSFICDTVSDIPSNMKLDGYYIYMGSIAKIIETGDIYMVNSNSEWILQTNGGGSPESNLEARVIALEEKVGDGIFPIELSKIDDVVQ